MDTQKISPPAAVQLSDGERPGQRLDHTQSVSLR